MFVYVGAITSTYQEPRPPLYERPAPLPRQGNMGEDRVGITVLGLEPTSGALQALQTVTELRNPTYLARHPSLPLVYAGERETTVWGPNETLAGAIATLRIGSDGQLTVEDRLPIGFGATYLSMHPTGRFLFAAAPGPHCVAAFPIEQDGRVEPARALVQHHGQGVNTITMGRPYPHSIRPDASGRRVMACDMGLDRVLVYDLDTESGRLEPSPHPFAQVATGAGPRHIWVHPNDRWVYVVNEIEASVTAFAYDAESSAMRAIGTTSTRPAGFAGHNTGAQIVVHPSGQFVYSSNRGHDSIALLHIDQDSGRTSLTQLTKSGGTRPRNFNIDATGAYLVVANQGSNSIVSFRIDQDSGLLEPTGTAEVANPVCVLF